MKAVSKKEDEDARRDFLLIKNNELNRRTKRPEVPADICQQDLSK